jgi:hypothetical protein
MGKLKDTAALVRWAEEEQLNWASNVLCDLKDKHAKALDMQGVEDHSQRRALLPLAVQQQRQRVRLSELV